MVGQTVFSLSSKIDTEVKIFEISIINVDVFCSKIVKKNFFKNDHIRRESVEIFMIFEKLVNKFFFCLICPTMVPGKLSVNFFSSWPGDSLVISMIVSVLTSTLAFISWFSFCKSSIKILALVNSSEVFVKDSLLTAFWAFKIDNSADNPAIWAVNFSSAFISLSLFSSSSSTLKGAYFFVILWLHGPSYLLYISSVQPGSPQIPQKVCLLNFSKSLSFSFCNLSFLKLKSNLFLSVSLA